MVDKGQSAFAKNELIETGDVNVIVNNFAIDQSARLEQLSLDELVNRYNDIDRQSQLFKGQILLEARNRFQSNVEFGKWLSVNFTELDSSNIGKLINLAKFFRDGRTLEGIPLSAGYLLSSPSNEDVATDVYEAIKEPLINSHREI